MGYTTICDVIFGLFMVSWFIARHLAYPAVLWSIHHDLAIALPGVCFRGDMENLEGPFPSPKTGYTYLFEPFYNPSGMVCFDDTIRWFFLGSLLALQIIIIVWAAMIVRVAIKVLSGTGAEDVRSDDEEEEEDEDEFIYEEAQPLEEEVGVESLNLKNWERRSGVVRPSASASGVNIPGHSDRKELLGRIGCDKQMD
jgi:very-long-chain ceramide synthase